MRIVTVFLPHVVRRALAVAWLAALAFLLTNVAWGAEITWRTPRFRYVAQNKDLGELLRELARSQGMVATVAEGVQGTVNGRFDLSPESMLELMATTHDFVWYFDGTSLQITPANSVRTDVIQLRYTTADRLQAEVTRLGIADHRFPLRGDASTSAVRVSGPPGYVDLVQRVAQSADHEWVQRSGAVLRIFPLHYAWAADRQFDSHGERQVIPGVASVLRSMYRPSAHAPQRPRPAGAKPVPPRSPLGSEPRAATAANDDARAPADEEELPVIAANPSTNSVLVRDLPGNMAQHEAAIRALDVQPSMVEIEAHVIELNGGESSNIGIDWHAATSHVDLQSGTAGVPFPAPPAQRGNGQTESVLPGAALTTVLGNSGRFLLARINALSQEGKGRIAASPRVVTLNSQEAIMDQTQTLHVRVAGYQSAQLFDVTAGVTLRVTPLIVGEGTDYRIKLDVRIQDGRLDDRTVDQIPVIQSSEISTQAVIADGEALLIGGYTQESTSSSTSGVPGLSSVPVVGALFRHQEKNATRVERMFLLAPRILKPAAGLAGSVAQQPLEGKGVAQ